MSGDFRNVMRTRQGFTWTTPIWAVAVLGLAIVVGASIASGSLIGYVIASAAVLLALVVIAGQMGVAALVIWIVADPIVAPFSRFPTAKAVVTFDRVWLLACVGTVLFARRRVLFGPATRRFVVALAAFGLVYGANAVVTFGRLGDLTPPATFVDSYLLAVVAFVVTRWTVVDRRQLRLVMVAVAVSAAANAMIAFSQLVFDYSFAANYNTVTRRVFKTVVWASGGFETPEELTVQLLVGEAAVLYLLQTTNRRSRQMLGLLTLGVILAGLGLVFFRTGWAAAIIVLLIAVAFRPRKYRPIFWVCVAILGAATYVLLQASDAPDPTSVAAAVQRHTFGSESLLVRVATYRQGLDMFAQSPILGIGIQQYEPTALRTPVEVIGGYASVPQAHDSFVAVMVEQGLLGLALFLVVLVFAARLLRDAFHFVNDPGDVVLVASGIGAAVGYLLMSTTFQMLPMAPSNAYLMVLLGCIGSALDLARAGRGQPDIGSSDSKPVSTARSGYRARPEHVEREPLRV